MTATRLTHWFSGRGNETALAEANAALRRMDQVAELLGTLAFGWCITYHGSLTVLPVITLAALLALPLEVWCIQRVCQPAYAEVHKPASQPHNTCWQPLPSCSIVLDLSACGPSVASQYGSALQTSMCLDTKRINFDFPVKWHEHAVFTF